MTSISNRGFFRRNFFLFACALFCLPLFFINIRNSHDWGDDFAQYILQAKNIVAHVPQTETGYVYDPSQPVVAPPAYPSAFPLMLAGIYAWKGNSVIAFIYLVTSLLFLLCLAMCWFFRRYFSELTAVCLTLIFAYSAWTLNFKTQILSDIPFTLFFLLAAVFYLRDSETISGNISTGICAGILVSIRGVGAVFFIAVGLHGLCKIFRSRKSPATVKQLLMRLCYLAATAAIIFVLLNIVLVKVPSGKFLEFYSHAYNRFSVGEIIIQNLNYYTDVFQAYFDQGLHWTFVNSVIKSFALVLLVTGFLFCILYQRTFIDLLGLIYFLLIIIYPYSAGGFRFLLPVFPFILYYMVMAAKQAAHLLALNRHVLTAGVILCAAIQFCQGIAVSFHSQQETISGPQQPASSEAFQYIQNNVPSNSIVLFKKPKALALYTGRKTASTVYYQSAADVHEMIRRLRIGYLLLNQDQDPELSDQPLKKYEEEYASETQLAWQNSKFLLYKVR